MKNKRTEALPAPKGEPGYFAAVESFFHSINRLVNMTFDWFFRLIWPKPTHKDEGGSREEIEQNPVRRVRMRSSKTLGSKKPKATTKRRRAAKIKAAAFEHNYLP